MIAAEEQGIEARCRSGGSRSGRHCSLESCPRGTRLRIAGARAGRCGPEQARGREGEPATRSNWCGGGVSDGAAARIFFEAGVGAEEGWRKDGLGFDMFGPRFLIWHPPPPPPPPRGASLPKPADRMGRRRTTMADATRNLQMTTDAFRRGNYSSEDDGRNESEVMGNIHGYYKEAVDRLPSSLDPLVHEVGFSFGFFDPVSNIIANTSAAYGASSSSPVPAVEKEADREGQQGGRGKKRRRSQAGTRSKAKGKKMVSCESGGDATRQRGKLTCCAGASSIAARSLDGLVTFLTTYFRYLHTSEALRYLRLARADLLVAVRLIEEDRDSEAFTVHHPTTRVALTCAALSAMGDQVTGSDDPKVTGLVNSSLMLASRLSKVSPLLAIQGRLCSATLNQLFELSLEGTHGTADSDDGVIMLNAISRFPSSIKKTPYPFDLELVLTKVLQDRIHGFNLKAMSCIPAPCLRSRHHRSLLKAGHCYGPFDPITNIILNTIWYDTVFPPHQEFEVDVINYETLARTECRRAKIEIDASS
nr:unnamed protein product [Digitaria exilis]